MTTTTLSPRPFTDSRIMVRRNVVRLIRYPGLSVLLTVLPVVFLLLFVFVLGDTMGKGLGAQQLSRTAYLDFIVPGLLVMALASAAQGTAISIAMDLQEGIIARFRTMPIARSAVLVGHVVGSLIQSALCVVALLGVALLVGYRPAAGVGGWLGALGVACLAALALTWTSLGLGLAAKSVETASNTPMILTLLPFMGSGFVPVDSLPAGVRWFAQWQPFTPVIDAIRGFLASSVEGRDVALATGWCVVITVVTFLWVRHRFVTRPVAS